MDTWTLINYFDVWGNAEDGYEVNNQCVEAEDIVIADDATDADIINYLQLAGYLNTNETSLFEVEDNGDFIEICVRETGMMLYSLRRNVA